MRLFIAFDVSEEARAELSRLQDELKKTDSRLNIVKEFHLTLKFLGEVNEADIEKIKELLAGIKCSSFDAELGRIGVFPSENFMKVVWVGLEPEDRINALQQQIEDALASIFPKDPRPFHPHITLARVKSIADREEFNKKIRSLTARKERFGVKSFRLIKSTLAPEGPAYEVLEEYKIS